MQWCVAKTGFELFDMLHAYGLAILLTYASRLPVSVRDESLTYRISARHKRHPRLEWRFLTRCWLCQNPAASRQTRGITPFPPLKWRYWTGCSRHFLRKESAYFQ